MVDDVTVSSQSPMCLDISEVLDRMAALVRVGDFKAAARVGRAAHVNLAVEPSDIVFGDPLAAGSESTIYATIYNGEDAVIKVVTMRSTHDLHRYRKEMAILSTLRDPNIIRLVGARALPPRYSMILPRYQASLEALLHVCAWRPSLRELLYLAIRITQAVAAVHTAGLVHRDIKPGNILVNTQGEVVLADFGVAEYERSLHAWMKNAPSGGFHKGRIVGTLQYLPPEVLLNRFHEQASDIYALAVTLNEVATGVVPFSDCVKENPACHTVLDAGYGHQELAAAVVAEELRPCTTAASPPAWSQLMSHCWQAEPSLRPNAADILCHLQALAVSEGIQEPSAQVMGQNIAAKLVRLQNGQPAPANMDKTAPSLMGTVPLPTWQQEAEERKGLQPAMVAGVYADCGLRGVSCMEDRHVCANPIAGLPKGHTGPTLLAVIDGHRGNQAAEFVAGQLDVHLRNAWLHAASAEAALAAALNGCESSFATQQQAEWDAQQQRLGPHVPLARPFPGCTVVAILQVSSLIAWANIGDCRAVLCRNGKAVQLTRDHIVADVEERKRIEAAGWIVKQAPDGSLRVGKAMLEVSRSIGDLDAKGGEGQGELTSDVDTGHFWVEAEDEFLVLASDGLWDVLGNKDVVALVHDTVKNPSMAAKRLAMEALARGSTDNVTVLICFLKDVGMLERIYSAGKHTYASPAATHFGSRRAFLAALSSGHARDEICEQL